MKFVGGRLCLDFINTVEGRVSRPGRKRSRDYADNVLTDKIAGYADLVGWGRLAGVAGDQEARLLLRRAAGHPGNAAETLARAIALREALYRIFKAAIERWHPEDADMNTLRRELTVARAHEHFLHSSGAFAWAWDEQPLALDYLLWPICRSAADLLASSSDLSRVRQCGGEKCGWIFLDTSRNRSRHWCDMRDCGNRTKVRRFRQRRERPAKET